MMKIATFIVTAFLASTGNAFLPLSGSNNNVITSSTSLSAASINDDKVKPNAAIKAMAQGMNVLKPIFGVEAQLQAAVLGEIGNVDEQKVVEDIKATITENNVVIYTYSLSPFSTEAVRILEATGCEFEKVELGAEWFLLGGEESVARVALSKMTESGATSLPKIFIGGRCIGGCSELATLVQSGQFDVLMNQFKSPNGQRSGKIFGLF